ncbi:MAG: exodeoxyribonuclease V subunit alpha [Pseudomonadota bacterium]
MAVTPLSSIVLQLAREIGGGDPTAELAVALACQATQAGHVCADLDREAGWGPWVAQMDAAQRADFRARLGGLSSVGGDADWTPLVLDGSRLYLRRYRDYELRVARDLLARAGRVAPLAAALAARLESVFPDAGQRAAACIALERRLCLVSGGPGTGKTHALARIIGLLREQEPGLRVGLAAPTGKAAARMAEALAAAGTALPPQGAMTLHRLLGMRSDGGCRHDRARPLALDALVVDEASMIDLSLMAHLLDALPPAARLILLGDRDQLAAVEAGAVFADLCASTALAASVAPLTTSFRFGGAIGGLAVALRSGDAEATLGLLRTGGTELEWRTGGDARALLAAARAGHAPFRAAVAQGLPPAELFERFTAFRVLCAHRHEVAAINRALAQAEEGGIAAGLPVMVVRNDPLLRLFNGDIGLALPDPADGELKACFPLDGDFRWIAFARLPEWEPAWAMTVHKSQGSEFARVLLALPDEPSPVATRELVYTGITRAREGVALWADEAVLRSAVACRAERMSGLREILRAGA